MKSTNYNVEKTFSVCWSCIARKSNWILFTGRVAWLGAKWRRWSPIMTLTTKNKLNTFHHHIRVWSIKVLNIYIYEGSENPFLITRVYSTKWLCTYDMLFYPFDTQVKETQFWIGKHIMFQLALYRVVPCCWHPLVTQPPRSLFRQLFTKDIPDLELVHNLALLFIHITSWKPNTISPCHLQLELIPHNQTYSGDKELTQYFIRWAKSQSVKMSWYYYDFRKSSMQLSGDNSTISVKVFNPVSCSWQSITGGFLTILSYL